MSRILFTNYNINKFELILWPVGFSGLGFIDEEKWAGVGPMRRLGAVCGVRVLWYFPIIMTSSRVSLYGISWCLCKYKVEVMRRLRRFVWGSRFRGLWAYLWTDFNSDWTVGILRKLSIWLTMVKSSKGAGIRFNLGPRQWRDFEGSPPDGKSALTTL